MMHRIVTVLICTTAYAVVRYWIFGQVSLSQLPVFLFNKSISMASALFLLAAAWDHSRHREDRARLWAGASLRTAFLHTLLSLCILNSAYFPRLFASDQLNISGGIAILCGVLAAYCYWNMWLKGSRFEELGSLQLLSALLLCGHLTAMGWMNWAAVDAWPGWLPPISLLSFLCAASSLILFSLGRHPAR